jgi:hypothetical protein
MSLPTRPSAAEKDDQSNANGTPPRSGGARFKQYSRRVVASLAAYAVPVTERVSGPLLPTYVLDHEDGTRILIVNVADLGEWRVADVPVAEESE